MRRTTPKIVSDDTGKCVVRHRKMRRAAPKIVSDDTEECVVRHRKMRRATQENASGGARGVAGTLDMRADYNIIAGREVRGKDETVRFRGRA